MTAEQPSTQPLAPAEPRACLGTVSDMPCPTAPSWDLIVTCQPDSDGSVAVTSCGAHYALLASGTIRCADGHPIHVLYASMTEATS